VLDLGGRRRHHCSRPACASPGYGGRRRRHSPPNPSLLAGTARVADAGHSPTGGFEQGSGPSQLGSTIDDESFSTSEYLSIFGGDVRAEPGRRMARMMVRVDTPRRAHRHGKIGSHRRPDRWSPLAACGSALTYTNPPAAGQVSLRPFVDVAVVVEENVDSNCIFCMRAL